MGRSVREVELGGEGVVQGGTAFGTFSRAITHDTLIGEVAIMRTLIPCSASVWNIFAATPGWLAFRPRSGGPSRLSSSSTRQCSAERGTASSMVSVISAQVVGAGSRT